LRDEHYADLKQDASDMLKMLLGSSWHLMMEKSANSAMVETKLEMPWDDGVTISGIIDLYFPADRLVVDHKTASVWAFILDKGAKQEWITQLNIYEALLSYHGHRVDTMQIWGLATDWNAGKALGGNGYPEIPFKVVNVPMVAISPIIDKWIQRYRDKDPCNAAERWTRDTQYAVMKSGRKSALRVLDTRNDAEAWMVDNADKIGKGAFIEKRPGKAMRCSDYCLVRDYCEHRG